MVNVPPPLLCSTPPPIDFGEDDDDSGLQSTLQLEDGDGDADEYSQYGLVTEPHEVTLSTKVPSLSELSISSVEPRATELANGHAKETVEAFNYQVKAPEFNAYAQEVPPPLPEANEEEPEELVDPEEQQAEVEVNTNDNIPSLKLDSLSLYSSDSLSPSCTLSAEAEEAPEELELEQEVQQQQQQQLEQPSKAPILCHQVTLEDVSDDSDEECSPKKPKELFIPEGAADFFAIEIIATPTPQPAPVPSKQLPNFTTFQESPPEDTTEQQTKVNDVVANELEDDDDFGDFGDFADFSEAPAPAPVAEATLPVPASSPDDAFDDFQDFETPLTTAVDTAVVEDDDDDDDDDDEFGDFSEPSYVTAETTVATPVLPQPPPPAVSLLSITERVKPVLDLMFPNPEAGEAQKSSKQLPLSELQSLQFGGIEQAHALDYQWISSEMRHSLVRSLGIDSRNILFGDKWNASMPRFAANLSYDPLKPLKPLVAAPTALLDSRTSWQSSTNNNNNNNNCSLQSLEGLETAAATSATTAATQASQVKTQSGIAAGQGKNSSSNSSNIDEAIAAALCSTNFDDTAAATSVFAAATATATLSIALPADSNGQHFDDSEQLTQSEQQLDLSSCSPPPTPPPTTTAATSQQLHEVNSSNSYALPLKETHIYTPSKSDTVVAKTTTLTPIDFDYEIASAGIIIDETVVKKEYRDVEYKPPPFGLDSPSKLKAAAEDDDFSDFQSVSAIKNATLLQQPPRNGTPTFGEQMILSPAILLPQTIPLAKPSIEWGDNALANINAEELARIEELFAHQQKPPTISATIAQQSPKQQPRQQQQQQQEDDEWSDFVSVPVPVQHQQQQQQHQQHNHNNNVLHMQPPPAATVAAAVATNKEDDWSDFVSSTPLSAALNARAAPQFNSGAWQSANFYNNPMSLYQQQQQPHAHSNLVPKGNNNNNNSNNNNNNVPQQIHMMHDFSTAPAATALTAPATYQQQHHQHHQQQLQQQQQQQRQHLKLGNAKVAPRISLIPDLSFVAPALPTNAVQFMSSLPKPSFSAKK